jgi:phage terminase large subunit-like protein
MDPVGRNADPTLTLDSLLERSEVVTVGIDGGGLDDLLGLAVIGRERLAGEAPEDDEAATAEGEAEPSAIARLSKRRWLHWGHAWAHPAVLERRKEIAPRLLDFRDDGDLTIVERIGEDVAQLADFVARIRDAGLLPDQGAIGVDQAGLGGIVDEIAERDIDTSPEAGIVVGIPQGWKLMNAIKTVERKLAGGTFIHGGRRIMAWTVGNAKIVPVGNAISITKQASGFAKIDLLAALIDGAALMAMNPQSGRGLFDYYRDAAAAGQRPPPGTAARLVRLRAPPGISTVYGLSGRQYLVGADGVVAVTADDAVPLVGQNFAAI